jgi:hypothetical protein
MQFKSRANVWHMEIPFGWALVFLILLAVGIYAAEKVVR